MMDTINIFSSDFKSMYQSLPTPVIIWDYESLKILFINDAASSSLHLNSGIETSKLITSYFFPVSKKTSPEDFIKQLRDSEEMRKLVYKDKNGSNQFFEATFNNITIEEKKHRVMCLNDVTEHFEALDDLISEQKQLIKLIELCPHGALFIIDNELKICLASGLDVKEFNLNSDNLINKNILDLVPSNQQSKFQHFIDELCTDKNPAIKLTYEDLTFQVAGNCIFDLQKNPIRALLVFQNITNQLASKNEIQFQSDILKKVNDAVIVKNLEGVIQYWNEGATKVFGYSADEMIGASIGMILAKDYNLSGFYAVRDKILETGMVSIEADAFCKDGSIITIETHQSLKSDASGKPECIICVSRDVSKKVNDAKILQESEANLNAIFQSTSQSFVLLDTEFKVIAFNKNAENAFKKLMNENLVQGEYYSVFLNPAKRNQFVIRMKQVLKKETVRLEAKFDLPNGTSEYLEVTYSPVINNDKVIAIVGCGENLTEKVVAKIGLEESEQKYRDLVETSIDLIWSIDSEGTLLFANNAALENFGWLPEEILGHNFLNFVSPDQRQRVRDDVINAFKKYKHFNNYQSKMLTKDGRVIDLLTNAVFYNENGDNNRLLLTATSRNISDRVKAEAELNEKNQQLRRLSSYLQSVREEERSHISREIHDELGQQLTGIKMDLFSINKKFLGTFPELQLKLNEVIKSVDETVKSVRKIASDLRPGILDDLGLVPAIEWQCQEFQRRNQIEVNFNTVIKNPSISKDVATGVFRILQEALTNIVRHSSARILKIELTQSGLNYMLIVSDNGIGFEVGNILSKNTLGLVGMQERATMLDGSLTFYSEPGKGTDIILEFPIFNSEIEYDENINSR